MSMGYGGVARCKGQARCVDVGCEARRRSWGDGTSAMTLWPMQARAGWLLGVLALLALVEARLVRRGDADGTLECASEPCCRDV